MFSIFGTKLTKIIHIFMANPVSKIAVADFNNNASKFMHAIGEKEKETISCNIIIHLCLNIIIIATLIVFIFPQ